MCIRVIGCTLTIRVIKLGKLARVTMITKVVIRDVERAIDLNKHVYLGYCIYSNY
jgi:hypothetical protein